MIDHSCVCIASQDVGIRCVYGANMLMIPVLMERKVVEFSQVLDDGEIKIHFFIDYLHSILFSFVSKTTEHSYKCDAIWKKPVKCRNGSNCKIKEKGT